MRHVKGFEWTECSSTGSIAANDTVSLLDQNGQFATLACKPGFAFYSQEFGVNEKTNVSCTNDTIPECQGEYLQYNVTYKNVHNSL